jgi:hypothetical protein
MTHYLIDIRLTGSVKHQIRNLSNHLQEKFNLGDKRVIPHITLAGPFSTLNEKTHRRFHKSMLIIFRYCRMVAVNHVPVAGPFITPGMQHQTSPR